MRGFAFFVVFMLTLFHAESQTEVWAETGINCDTLITEYDWKTDSLMHEVFNRWERTGFVKLLKKHNVGKIDCGDCEGVTAKIQFYINSEGKMQSIKLLQSNKCGFPFTEKFTIDFINSFSNLVFPEILRNSCYHFYAGRRLKC
jgi:hypothetical protein